MEGPWRGYGVAHGVHQNAPKCTEMVTMHHSMTEQSVSNLSRVTYIFEINGHLKEARSQSMSWRGHGVALAPKWTKMHQKGHLCKTDEKLSNLSSMTNMHMRFAKTRNCYRKGSNNTMHFQEWWCFLVQLMHYPMTPLQFALTSIPFQLSISSRNGLY